jgi:hypothetical protein
VGGAAGSRTCRLARARSHQSRKSHHHQRVMRHHGLPDRERLVRS